MRFFHKIYSSDTSDTWSSIHPSLLYIRQPRDRSEFHQALDELDHYSLCEQSGRCCLMAPQLTVEEDANRLKEFPNYKFKVGHPCPFFQDQKCILHFKKHGLKKPLQCRSYTCQPSIRNLNAWRYDFCKHFDLDFKNVY